MSDDGKLNESLVASSRALPAKLGLVGRGIDLAKSLSDKRSGSENRPDRTTEAATSVSASNAITAAAWPRSGPGLATS